MSYIQTSSGLGFFNRRLTIWDGDSVTLGRGLAGITYGVNDYPTQCKEAVSPSECFGLNVAVSGENSFGLPNCTPIPGVLYAVFIGLNDIISGFTPADILNNLSTKMPAWRAFGSRVLVGTMYRNTVFSEPQRATLNAGIQAGLGVWCDYVADFGSAPELQNPADLTYYQPDGFHLTASGCGILAAVAAPHVRQGMQP